MLSTATMLVTICCFFFLTILPVSAQQGPVPAPQTNTPAVQIYPAPEGLQKCEELAIELNGQPVFTEAFRPNYVPDARLQFYMSPNMSKQGMNIAMFGCSKSCQLTIRTVKPLTTVTVRPKSLKIPVITEGNTATLTLPGPCKLVVAVNDLPPLFIFANPIETEVPTADTPNVRVFGPGVHTPGSITLQDNDQIYLAPGAVVYGGFRGSPKNARVFGRGILDGSKTRSRLGALYNAKNVEFEGILMRCGTGFQNEPNNSDNITYRNIKVISSSNFGDGLDPVSSRNIRIDDCFICASDDCIAIKGQRNRIGPDVANILVENSVLCGYMVGDGVTVGFEANAKRMSNITVRNCDVVFALGPNGVDGHSGFSIINGGPAGIENVLYENNRVEADVYKNFELYIMDGTFDTATPGVIKGVTIRNVHWEVEHPIIIRGRDTEHQVEDITFENCTIAGKPLVMGDIITNEFVRNIRILPEVAAPAIVVKQLDALQPVTTVVQTRINPKDGAEMVFVPAGEFIMGSDFDTDERPPHAVMLDGYWIYKTEVTLGAYRKYCQQTGHATPPETGWLQDDTHPVVFVSWEDAAAYAKWAGGALPSEAQWEKAARGTDSRIYPWGNEWDSTKCDQGIFGTRPVGQHPTGASPYGALDMVGSVWEWCADWYAPDYYLQSTAKNPTGPSSGTARVLRGGSWINVYGVDRYRTTTRNRLSPTYRLSDYGFRCVVMGQ